jgi:hypothetical protein
MATVVTKFLQEVIWNVAFEPPNTIRIETCGMRIRVNRLRIALPRWASVEVRVSETALADRSETIAVNLAVRHPWLGEIFGYCGWFLVRREMKHASQHNVLVGFNKPEPGIDVTRDVGEEGRAIRINQFRCLPNRIAHMFAE